MVTFVLAGVLGSVLAVGDVASESDQAKALPSGGLGAAAVGPHRLIRFGQRQTPDVAPDSTNGGPCRLVEPSDHKDIDPGIFAPPRDPQINFTIKRIVPKGCVDPGIFIPKRQK